MIKNSDSGVRLAYVQTWTLPQFSYGILGKLLYLYKPLIAFPEKQG